MITHKYLDEFEALYKSGDIILNKDRVALLKYLREVVLVMDGVYFDEQAIEDYVNFTEKWLFKDDGLEPFQKMLACMIFLYFEVEEGEPPNPVFNQFDIFMGRGAGKNGWISSLVEYFISPLCGIPEYHVAIVANSERQAQKSFMEVHNMLKKNPELLAKNGGYFNNGLSKIECVDTLSTIEYLTSNADTKDSFAHGVLIFDEIHQYENPRIVNVLRSGLGKVQPPRTFYISTNGYVRDGVYDKRLEQSRRILKNTTFESRTFPWLCFLDKKSEANDPKMWQKANPMLHEPLSYYAKGLKRTISEEWTEVQKGLGDKTEFLIKRMNVSDVDTEKSVASRAEILATNREIPDDLSRYQAVGGLDYASLKDFAAVGLLFKREEELIWLSHSFVRKEFLDNFQLTISDQIPIWQDSGLLTVVDEPTISIDHITDWFVEMRKTYDFNMVVGDTYRMDYVRNSLENAGFEVDFVRRAKAIEATVAPQIEVDFAEKRLIWGENPLMNWYTNNVLVVRDKFGNMSYEKKSEVRRKTDGFMAFTHAYWKGLELFKDMITEDPFEYDDSWIFTG